MITSPDPSSLVCMGLNTAFCATGTPSSRQRPATISHANFDCDFEPRTLNFTRECLSSRGSIVTSAVPLDVVNNWKLATHFAGWACTNEGSATRAAARKRKCELLDDFRLLDSDFMAGSLKGGRLRRLCLARLLHSSKLHADGGGKFELRQGDLRHSSILMTKMAAPFQVYLVYGCQPVTL